MAFSRLAGAGQPLGMVVSVLVESLGGRWASARRGARLLRESEQEFPDDAAPDLGGAGVDGSGASMGFAPTDEQAELGRTAERLLADAVADRPVPPAWEAVPQSLDRRLWATLAGLGLLGLGVREEVGGSGGGTPELCLLAERTGAAVPTVPLTGVAAVTAVLAERAEGSAAGAALSDVVKGAALAVPAWETFPRHVIPGRRSGRPTRRLLTPCRLMAASVSPGSTRRTSC